MDPDLELRRSAPSEGEEEAPQPAGETRWAEEFGGPEPGPGTPADGRPGGWGVTDVILLVLFSIPAFAVSAVLCLGALQLVSGQAATQEALGTAPVIVAIQLVWWLLLLGFIYLIVTRKYRLRFGQAIGWKRPARPATFYAVGGVLLAFSVAAFAQLIPMPEEELPIEELFKDPSSALLLAVFGVLLAPLAEEFTFRGFLYPAFERALGAAAAVVITAALFSFVHAQQYGGHWQNLLLLLYVGIVFGAVRARTQSLIPSTILHAAYNATLFAGFFSANEQMQRL